MKPTESFEIPERPSEYLIYANQVSAERIEEIRNRIMKALDIGFRGRTP